MLTNPEMLCVSPQSTIQHAITQMNASRAEIVLVVDEDTRLLVSAALKRLEIV